MKSYTIVPDHSECELSVLKSALDRSRNFTERVAVEFHGTFEAFYEAIGSITDDEQDDARQDDGTIDVWGWDGGTPEGEQKWRLCVTLV